MPPYDHSGDEWNTFKPIRLKMEPLKRTNIMQNAIIQVETQVIKKCQTNFNNNKSVKNMSVVCCPEHFRLYISRMIFLSGRSNTLSLCHTNDTH